MEKKIKYSIKYLTAMRKTYQADSEVLSIAIDTMRKYQMIEQAYKKYLNDMVTNIYADSKFIRALREVLEDGNVD